MERKSITIVGIAFHKEELNEILQYIKQRKIFSMKECREFNKKLNQDHDIISIYQDLISNKNIVNAPNMELLDSYLIDEYYLGYRIIEETIEIPTNAKVLAQIKTAQDNWFNLFGEMPQTQSISFDIY